MPAPKRSERSDGQQKDTDPIEDELMNSSYPTPLHENQSTSNNGNGPTIPISGSLNGKNRKRAAPEEVNQIVDVNAEVKRTKVEANDMEVESSASTADAASMHHDDILTVDKQQIVTVIAPNDSSATFLESAIATTIMTAETTTKSPSSVEIYVEPRLSAQRPSELTSLEPTRTLPTIDRLRIPSKHTPGKANDVVSVPNYSRSTPHVEPTGTTELLSKNRIGLALNTPKQPFRPAVSVFDTEENNKAKQHWNNAQDNREEDAIQSPIADDFVAERKLPKSLSIPFVWIFILSFPYLLFLFPTLAPSSSRIMSLYQGFFFSDLQVKLSSPIERNVLDEVDRMRENLHEIQESIRHSESAVAMDISRNFHHVSDELAPQVQALGPKEIPGVISNFLEVIKHLDSLLDLKEEQVVLSDPVLASIRKKLESSIHLVDISGLELGDIGAIDLDRKGCDNPPRDLSDTTGLISEVEFINLQETLLDDVKSLIRLRKEQPSTIQALKSWIRTQARTFLQEIQADKSIGDQLDKAYSTILTRLQNFINERLELETADSTGEIDYASIANGANVIKLGPVATSPSVVENLPLFNRVAHMLKLRFYGYGPEAALTPTVPATGLGQCWSFQADENGRSKYGTLSVSLAKPIYVKKISIEHPTADISDRWNTAIRFFRIIGFEDVNDASTQRHELGTFEFNSGNNVSGRQSFYVRTENIPLLRAISLEVDTNWGGEYICLYRFRVHGLED